MSRPCTWQAGIPTRLLTVLQEEVLVAVAFVIDDIGIAPRVLQRLHVADALGVDQLGGCFPSSHPALIAGVACGLIAVVVVGAAVHEVPVTHALTAAVVGVVEVGIAEAVAELVAHGADASHVPLSPFSSPPQA